jgi:L-amino acid N-acyltransferase YncA
MRLSLRPATRDDSSAILRWRNHPTARRVSFQDARIGRAEHNVWLEEKLKNPNCHLYVIQSGNRKLGQIRLDGVGANRAFVSIVVDSKARRHGVGSEALRQLHLKCGRNLRFWRLQAHIKPNNSASLILFLKVGYKLRGTIKKKGISACVLEKII